MPPEIPAPLGEVAPEKSQAKLRVDSLAKGGHHEKNNLSSVNGSNDSNTMFWTGGRNKWAVFD